MLVFASRLSLVGIGVTHCYPFFFQDGPHRGEGPLVDWTLDMLMGHGVRHGVDLELEADLDDIEGSDAESMIENWKLAFLLLCCCNAWRPYREISPAIPPARTTCRRVPWKMSVIILLYITGEDLPHP